MPLRLPSDWAGGEADRGHPPGVRALGPGRSRRGQRGKTVGTVPSPVMGGPSSSLGPRTEARPAPAARCGVGRCPYLEGEDVKLTVRLSHGGVDEYDSPDVIKDGLLIYGVGPDGYLAAELARIGGSRVVFASYAAGAWRSVLVTGMPSVEQLDEFHRKHEEVVREKEMEERARPLRRSA